MHFYRAFQLLLLLLSISSSESSAIDLIVVGDSTAADYSNDPTAFPRNGWAMHLQDFLDPSAVVVRDLAASGRSSKSFIDENRWAAVKADHLSAGDFVFIQFGHNDQKTDALRHTEPFTTYKDYLRIYINDTTQAGANPVLLTSISRAIWSETGVLEQTLGDYPEAMRQLAIEMKVPLIDLNKKTAQLFTQLGEKTTQDTLFMCLPKGKFPNYPDGINDTTHLQVEGAKQVAKLAAQGIIDHANLRIKLFVNTALVNNSSTPAAAAPAPAPASGSAAALRPPRRFGTAFPDPAH